jgi:hypothetical protein
LVVCAVSLVGQWADEARLKTDGRLRILQYHGQGRARYTAQELASDYDGEQGGDAGRAAFEVLGRRALWEAQRIGLISCL